MNIVVALLEGVAVLACFTGLILVFRGWRRSRFLAGVPGLVVILLILLAMDGLSNFLEWSEITQRFNLLENFIGTFIPFLWGFVFYAIFRGGAEADLKESREHFRNLVESTSDWIWEVDAGLYYTYVSPRIQDILGYTSDDIIGKRPFDLMAHEEGQRVLKEIEKAYKAHQPIQHLRNINLHKDGHEVILETNAVPILDSFGNLSGYRGIARDISERIRTDHLRLAQQAELESIFTASPAGIGIIRDRVLIRGNQRFCDISGYTQEELKRSPNPRQLYATQQEYERVGKAYQEAAEKGFVTLESQWIRKDGAVVDVMINISPLDANEPAKGFCVIAHDITDLKAARREAIEEKNKAQLYLNVAGMMIVVLNTEGRVTMVNQKGCEVLGYSRDQILGRSWFEDFLPGSYRQIIRSFFDQIIHDKGSSGEYFENPILTADGEERLIAWHNAVLRDASGKIVEIISSGQDITEIRAAEEALRASDQQLRLALSAARMGTWQWNTKTNQDRRDATLNAILGLEPVETTQSVEDFLAYVHPDDLERVRTEFTQAIDRNEEYKTTFRIIRTDGETRWVLAHGKAVYDYNGALTSVTGVFIDITERKSAEAALAESEERFRNIVNASPMGVHTYAVEPDGTLVFTGANPASSEILGIDLSDKIGSDVEDVFPFLPETNLPDIYRNLCREGGVYHETNFEYHRGDIEGYFEFTAFQTSPGKMAMLFTDVTERIVTEKALQFTQFSMDHSSEEVYWIDRDSNFVYVNDAACEMLGYSRKELLNMAVHDIDPDFPAAVWADHWKELKKKKTEHFETRHRTKDGRIFPVEITGNFFVFDDAEYSCAFCHDISGRKATEQVKEVLLEQVRERNKELQSIVYTATHDLRSPLVNITGFTRELEKGLETLAKILGDEPLTEEGAKRVTYLLESDIAESLKFVKYGSHQMNLLLNGLLRLSRVGSAQLSLSKLNINTLLEGVLKGLQYQIQEHNATITIPETLPLCMGDEALLGQVFTNLLDNAIKYHHPDRRPVIEIKASVIDHSVEYSISDNGIGIEMESLDKVFELFHRLGRKDDKDGEGMGLTIVRRILDRMHGSVRIESQPNQGTTVHIRLPSE